MLLDKYDGVGDDIDRSQARQYLLDQMNIAEALRVVEPAMSGFCLFCNSPVNSGRFCDDDCRDDYGKMQRFKR